jgi:chitodextrinase
MRVSYEVFQDGVSIGTTSSTTMNVTGLSETTTYTISVRAGDAAVNWSEQSIALDATTTIPIVTLVVTTSGENLPNEGKDKLHDGNLFNKWQNGGGNTAWIQFEYSIAQTHNTYSITSGNDVPERDPKDWTMSGSNDGVNWTLLDTKTGEPSWAARNSTLDFSFSNSTEYLFYKLNITDNHGDWTMQLSELSFSFIDSEIPTVPLDLASSNITHNSFTLSWTASTDNVGVTGYEIFSDGVSIGITATTSFEVTGFNCATSYSLSVRAQDAAPNWSAQCSAHEITTAVCPPDTEAPSVPIGLATSGITYSSFTLNWTASTDNVGVTGYEVFQDGISIGMTATTTMNITGLTCGTSYALTVRVQDAVPNWSAESITLNVATADCFVDTYAPSVPTGLASSNVTLNSFTLNWTASEDNIGVAGYEVFQDGKSVGTTTSTSMNVVGLTCDSSFVYAVRAQDDMVNWSAQSSPLNVSTLSCPDTEAPSVPSELVSSNMTQKSFILSWTASTDNVGVTAYEVFQNGSSIGTSSSSSFDVTGLTCGTNYVFTVSAQDAALNLSAQSSELNVTTLSCPDTDAPTVPTGLVSSGIAQKSFTLSWNESTDNVGVTAYEVFQDGTSIGTTENTLMLVSGLEHSTSYSMTVSAKDSEGNCSAQCSALQVNTLLTTVGISDILYGNENEAGITIYPNPAKSRINLSFISTNEENALVNVLDIQGRIVMQSVQHVNAGKNTLKMNVSSLKNGIYFVRFINGSDTFINKMIINK